MTKSWSYDAADRVLADASIHTVLTGTDENGDPTSTTADIGGTNAYSYDALGRVTRLPAGDTPVAQNLQASGSAATTSDATVAYYDTDAVQATVQDGTTTSYSLDPAGRRTTSTTTKDGAGSVVTTRDYADGTDSPSFATETVGSQAPVTSVYGASIGEDLGFTISNEGVALELADPHGDTVTAVSVPEDGSAGQLAGVQAFDEYGNQATDLVVLDEAGSVSAGTSTSSVSTGALTYGYLGGEQRAQDTTGLTLMGARLYNPTTGQFTSIDPVLGGNTTDYAYPQDPVNQTDTSGAIAGVDDAVVIAVLILVVGLFTAYDIWHTCHKGGCNLTVHAQHIPFPNVKAKSTWKFRLKKYHVYEIFRNSDHATWKFGITRAKIWQSRPRGQLPKCARSSWAGSQGCYYKSRFWVIGWYAARMGEAGLIYEYAVKHGGKCPPGQRYSCI